MEPELYAPLELVVTSVETPVSVRVMVTLAPTTAAPLGSVTDPLMLPVDMVAWAKRVEGSSRNRIANAVILRGNIWLREAFKRVIHFSSLGEGCCQPARSPRRRRASSARS